MIRQLGTRFLALFARASVCRDGPLLGEKLVLTEYSRSTAWVEVRGEVGRYVLDKGKLIWESRK